MSSGLNESVPRPASGTLTVLPADCPDGLQEGFDLNAFLMPVPYAAFVFRMSSGAMREAGILPGDYVVVDRSKTPKTGDIVLAVYQKTFMIRTLMIREEGYELLGDADVPVCRDGQISIFGVVTARMRRQWHWNNAVQTA